MNPLQELINLRRGYLEKLQLRKIEEYVNYLGPAFLAELKLRGYIRGN